MTRTTKGLASAALITASALVLAGCAGGDSSDDSSSGDALTIGTSDPVFALDPAAAYDNGSWQVMIQVYPFLMNSPYGSAEVEPDIATSAEFTAPTEYTVKLKEGLKFANGNDLTASDVKFTFDRQLKIKDDNGPWGLLENLESTEAVDDTTVVFHLKQENDQTFPQVLSSPVAPIVDEDVFPADKVLADADIVKEKPFAGQYTIESFKLNDLISYKAFDGYDGLLGAPKTSDVTVKYFTNENNLRLAIQEKAVDVATRQLSATDVEDLAKNEDLKVYKGPGGEIRFIVYNFNTQPFGATTAEADPAKALAVRQATADLIDRDALSEQVFKGTYTPLYSYVPEGLPGATQSLKGLYGDGEGGPDGARAAERLKAAGVETPVTLNLQYNPDHYGASSAEEYALIKSQLEEGGLFKVDLQATEWTQFNKDRVQDLYPLHQLGWFPDYSDADNYLTPFFIDGGFLMNHYSNEEVNELIRSQLATVDRDERIGKIEQIQDLVAADLSTLPTTQGTQVAVAVKDVKGVEDTLDASFKFRFGPLSK
ncbi:peptide/nickel transport system substrate-binding protein [Lysinibacter cavernae]|uniref:Peptide/nickel transport system substrate-binding protein n=1 Tax=Lysinibacter cavernae TaxID=1640652 RepID=A0A7X5QYF6_9MICO|nr:peptide/nickel transport system substrate-binding protein [Lysinibacter cavernae]